MKIKEIVEPETLGVNPNYVNEINDEYKSFLNIVCNPYWDTVDLDKEVISPSNETVAFAEEFFALNNLEIFKASSEGVLRCEVIAALLQVAKTYNPDEEEVKGFSL